MAVNRPEVLRLPIAPPAVSQRDGARCRCQCLGHNIEAHRPDGRKTDDIQPGVNSVDRFSGRQECRTSSHDVIHQDSPALGGELGGTGTNVQSAPKMPWKSE